MVEREQLISMVRGLQDGEEDAATRLYETFQSDIYYFILKTVNNDRELAEDLTQDTFIEILETIDKLQEPAAFVTWSRQIAYHKCTAYFRKRKELLVDENEDGYSVFDAIEEESIEFIPDAALDHEDLKQTIIKMINDLPEEQKSAILLRYFNEISVKEIAQIQGVTEGTVKSRLNYGRKSIKQAVEEFEKKNGVRLHCVGVLPLLLWLFKNYRIDNGLPLSRETSAHVCAISEETARAAVGSSASASAGSSAATATTTTAASGVATTATATVAKTAVGVGMKAAGKAVATKVIAVIAAATVTVGGVSAGVAAMKESENTESTYIETQEVWLTETTLAVVIEETSVSTEETSIPTETTKPPTEETTVETEVSTVEMTEAVTCEHDIITDLTCNSEYVYERRECSKCGMTEEVSYPNPCEHVWDYFTIYESDMIYEKRSCTICYIHEDVATYENTCEHDWEYYTRCEDGIIGEYKKCKNCTAAELIREYEATCEHDWILQSQIIGSEYIEETKECSKCGAIETITYENSCVHEWVYSTEVDSFNTYENRQCSLCGLFETVSVTETECQHTWYDYTEEQEDGTVITYSKCEYCGYIRNN